MNKKAILLSGGMDSYALTYLIKPDITITIDYGQRAASTEIQSSKILSQSLSIEHHVLKIDLTNLGSGDLSEKPSISIAPTTDWWPFRNQVLITLAGMYLIDLNINEIFIGCVNSDSSHIDGKEEFINAINKLMMLQEGGIKVLAPSINESTVELIKRSGIPISLLAWSHSCHISNIACGNCRGCIKHKNVTYELGLEAY